MRRAGLEISCLDLDGEFHRLMREQELRPEQVPPRLMNLLASIIAKHAPVPQPIRRGDVVQWQNDISNRISTGTVLRCRDGRAMIHLGHTHTSQLTADLTRIGRARYYPDGTPVED